MEKIRKILIICNDKNLSDIITFCLDGWGYEVVIFEGTVLDVNAIKKHEPDLIMIDFHLEHNEGLLLCKTLKADFFTAAIPIITLINKRHLRSQLLSLRQGIDDYLIKPPDPLDLRVRIEMALRRTQYSFYTNALTKLAGGRTIEELLKEKLLKREGFSFAHIDIDNFKYFNDCYGYLKGDAVIIQTAYILYDALKKQGGRSDFIGHIGGDDFVFMSTPEHEREIALRLINEFDRLIPLHYTPEDRTKGFIFTTDRSGIKRKIPLMSLSVAIVNSQEGYFKNIVEINEAIAGIKYYLKKLNGSKFMVERRKLKAHSAHAKATHDAIVFSHATTQINLVRPLGQLLLEKRLITQEKLDECLIKHWRTGIPIGEILLDYGVINSETLAPILQEQASSQNAY